MLGLDSNRRNWLRDCLLQAMLNRRLLVGLLVALPDDDYEKERRLPGQTQGPGLRRRQ